MTPSVTGHSMSSGIVGSVLQTTRLLRTFEEILAASSASELRPSVRAAINRLTYDIARASARGQNSVTVMQLRERQNFRRQIWYKRLWHRKPLPEMLLGDASALYKYCLKNGLNPDLTCFKYDLDNSQFLSSMKISWNNNQLVREVAVGHGKDTSSGVFCQALQTLMPNRRQLAVVARAKRSQALLVMPLVIRELDQAAKDGHFEKVVYKQLVSSRLSADLPVDIKDLCLLLGLKAVLHSGWIAGRRYFLVSVSGWAEARNQE